MNKTNSLLFVLALAGASAAWAEVRNPKPDWVDSQSVEYAQDRYITGVGAGDDRSVAQDRARAEISKVFSANVKVDTTLTESEINTGQGSTTRNSFSQSIAQNVKTLSEKVLEGVQVVEHWQDNASRVHYALAVLDRAKARAGVIEKLKEFDKQAQEWKDQLEKGGEKLARAKAGMRLMTLLKARADLNGELRVIEAAGRGLDSPLDEGAAKAAAAKAVSALDVAVDMSGQGSDEVETGLVRGLTALGLQAKVGAGRDPDITVEGKMETASLPGDGSKWKWARSNVTVSVKDARTGKIVSRFDASDREASSSYEEAVRRSHVELAKRLSDKISEAVTSYFENN